MGVNYGQRRQRMAGLRNPGDVVAASIGNENIKWAHFDEQLVFDVINKKLDIQEEKIRLKSEFFVR